MANVTTRTARSSALIGALVVGALLLVGAVIGAIPRLTGILGDVWNGRADLLTGRVPQVPVDGTIPDVPAGVDYAGVLISADAPLVLSRTLQVIAASLDSLLLIGAGLLVVLLALRMLQSRPFAKLLAWGLGGVSVLAVAASTIAPQLEAWAVDVAVRELGYAVYDSSHDGSFKADGPDVIALSLWDPLWVLDRIDPALLLIGIALGTLGLLTAHGVRLQRDTDGLV